jgi:hypothetical protein
MLFYEMGTIDIFSKTQQCIFNTSRVLWTLCSNQRWFSNFRYYIKTLGRASKLKKNRMLLYPTWFDHIIWSHIYIYML